MIHCYPPRGHQVGEKRIKPLFVRNPFHGRRLSLGALWENPGGKAPAKADAETYRMLGYLAKKKNASTGTARPPGRQGARVGFAPSRPRGPPRRRGWAPGTRGALPSPPPPGVGLLRCLSDGQRSGSRSRAPGVPACRSPLHGQEPATRCRSEFSGNLRRWRSKSGPGSNAPPSAFAATSSSSQPGLALLDPSLREEEEGNRRPGGASLCGPETIAAGRVPEPRRFPVRRALRLARVPLVSLGPHKRRLGWAESAADWAGGRQLGRRVKGGVGGACQGEETCGGPAHHKLHTKAQRLQLPSAGRTPANTVGRQSSPAAP